MKKSLIITMVAILFFATSCFSLADTRKTISVSGSGSVAIKADIVSFSINVEEKGETTAEAQQLANKKISQILTILRAYNIEDKDISTTSLNFSTDYYWDGNKQIKNGENVSQTVYVKMRDLDKFTSLVDNLGSNVNGISFYSVNFDLEDKSEAIAKARELAYLDAYEKAQTYADKAGMKIVSPLSISDGYYSVSTRTTSANGKVMALAEAAVDASYATEAPTGTLSVSVNTDITFQMK